MVENSDYIVSRVMTASPVQLILITYEALIEELEASIKNYKSNDIKDYDKNLNNCRNIIQELIHSLAMEYKPADDLLSIYAYCQKLVDKAQFRKDTGKVEECIKVLKPLYDGWKELEVKEQNEIQHMQLNQRAGNSQPTVAGMTYGRNDIDMIGGFSQEFKA